MATGTRFLIGALAVCALGVAPAIAQDHQSKTNITITDDGKKRHIVVEKDGKVVREEWTTSEPGSGYTIVSGKDGQYRFQRTTGGPITIQGSKANRISLAPGATIVSGSKDGSYRIAQGKDGTIILGDGKGGRVTLPSAPTTVRVGQDGKYRIDRAGGARIAVGQGTNKRYYTAPDVTVRSGSVRGQDIAKLLKSLTFDQREKQHDKGYLTLDDLTPQQRRLFIVPNGDNWTVSYEIDGNKVTIRSR